ncbi:hypothetical protein PT974_09545 [Cladobotryum mycophilum]|uniref:Antigenic cell wall galactomannoprotein n=1 Tax=Cladobotryum mycophilum TaxID=491253 RepID=A0ABR0SHQ2_9HYPO
MLFKPLALATVVLSALQVRATDTAKNIVVPPLHEITISTTEYVDKMEKLTPENVVYEGPKVYANIKTLTNVIRVASGRISDIKGAVLSDNDQSFITDALITAAYAEISFLKDLLAKHDLLTKGGIASIGEAIRCMKSFDDPYGDRLIALIPHFQSSVEDGFKELTAVYEALLNAYPA